MTDQNASAAASPPSTHNRPRPIAMSLFGGAILASAATAAVALDRIYIQTIGTLSGITVGPSGTYVAVGGYNTEGDGGGGILLPQSTVVSACVPDGGIVFMDHGGNCFVRADSNNSVRDWGAMCDVSVVTDGTWNVDSGTLWLPGTISQPPVPSTADLPEYIAISQIGVPTLWGSSTPAVSMTRFSTLSNAGTNYVPGDLISFAGGSFSQQAAIIVDAVDTNGAITQWHFLWGGLYNATLAPTGTMTQDNSFSYCGTVAATGSPIMCGTLTGQAGGATMMPAWSGWSVLNLQSVSNAGTGYTIGQVVTLTGQGVSSGQTHLPTLIVEGTTTSGGINAYDWLDYGSIPVTPAALTDANTAKAEPVIVYPVEWTQAPFATTIQTVGTDVNGDYHVTLADLPAFPGDPIHPSDRGTLTIKYLYYGHDDSGPISQAIKAAPKGGLVIPAGCGTTKTLNLSPPIANLDRAQNFDASLTGANLQSTGLYAFAAPFSQRSATPILAHVIYSGLLNTASNSGFVSTPGGGFSNMLVEGLGIPEGYGYYGLLQNAGTPTGYAGPTFGMTANNIPTAGNVVEIDAAKRLRINNVLISNGGIGPGNSILQCGLDEADPAHHLQSGSVATITVTDSRLDDDYNLSGATDPDFALRLDASCQNSSYDAVTAYDGTKADILVYGANLFSRVHLDSDAANHNTPLLPIPWTTTTFGMAGMADYGFYIIGHTSMSESQCDVANNACVLVIPTDLDGSTNPGQITDTQVKCGAFPNAPYGYSGVELSAGTANTTVTGTVSNSRCALQPFQVVKLDGGLDPSTSLCGNSYASTVGCTGYQGGFSQRQFYSQPAVSYAIGTVAASGLYAMPFFSPAGGGMITQLALDVTTATSAQCVVGIYNAAAQTPTSLVTIASMSTTGGAATAIGMVTISGTGTTTATLSSPGAALAPGTLYFLAVGCNAPVRLMGVKGSGGGMPSGGLSVPLVGAGARTDTTSGVVATSWTYTSGLPNPFGGVTRTSGAWVPNVYVQQ